MFIPVLITIVIAIIISACLIIPLSRIKDDINHEYENDTDNTTHIISQPEEETGFFSLSATCAICGKEVGLNRFKIGKTLDGKNIWKCPTCARKGGFLIVDYSTGKASFLQEKDTEIRKKCNVCGHLFCYTLYDLERNKEKARSAMISGVAGMAGALGGAYTASAVHSGNANNSINEIVDYNRCPCCGSMDIRSLNVNEWKAEQDALSTKANTTISAADELKKYKELLDSDIITQEEFEAKKKQLLNL